MYMYMLHMHIPNRYNYYYMIEGATHILGIVQVIRTHTIIYTVRTKYVDAY